MYTYSESVYSTEGYCASTCSKYSANYIISKDNTTCVSECGDGEIIKYTTAY